MARRPLRWALWVTFAGLAAYLVATLLGWPRGIERAEVWLRYRVAGVVASPLLVGQHGRLFLGNHAGDPPLSLITTICGQIPGLADQAGAFLRPVLDAGRATGVPFRLIVVPTPPRLYPEDLPAGIPCAHWPADQLHDPAIVYPVAALQAMKPGIDPIPRRHFHWAGEAPLQVAELVANEMGLSRALTLSLRPERRPSDFNGINPGLALYDEVRAPNLRAAGVAQCAGSRCVPALPDAIELFSRPGPGRILVFADSFGDAIAGDWSEYAGQVWHVRMNLALASPEPALAAALHEVHPDAVIVVYHDFAALALDGASKASLALAARLLDGLRTAGE